MDTTTLTTSASVTITLTLPKALIETLDAIARRDGCSRDDVIQTALEIYAERAADRLDANGAADSAHANEATLPAPLEMVGPPDGDPNGVSTDGERRFASLGAGESTLDDGYDSTNIKDWIRKTWRPDKRWAPE